MKITRVRSIKVSIPKTDRTKFIIWHLGEMTTPDLAWVCDIALATDNGWDMLCRAQAASPEGALLAAMEKSQWR